MTWGSKKIDSLLTDSKVVNETYLDSRVIFKWPFWTAVSFVSLVSVGLLETGSTYTMHVCKG